LEKHQRDFNEVSKLGAADVKQLGTQLLNLIKPNVIEQGKALANVFESLQGKTKEYIAASDYLKPALLNTVFGFRSITTQLGELRDPLTSTTKGIINSSLKMLEATKRGDDYAGSVKKLTDLESEVRNVLNQLVPTLSNYTAMLAKGGKVTGDVKTKAAAYGRVVSELINLLNTLSQAEENEIKAKMTSLKLQTSLIFSYEQVKKSIEGLAEISYEKLIKQYARAGIELSKSQKLALKEITETTTKYNENINAAQARVSAFTTYLAAKLQEQTVAWTHNKDEVQSFVEGLKIVGRSAAVSIIKNYEDIAVKMEEMGGFFGALGALTEETIAKTAVGAFEELNKAIIDSIVYGKQFQYSWQDILRSFTAGLIQAMLQLLEFKLAISAMKALGVSIPGVGGGGEGLFSFLFGKQKGGLIPGVGSGDKVPALLEPGEYVIPKPVVKLHGVDFFEGLRKGLISATPSVPGHYQRGGLVTPDTSERETKLTVVNIFDENELNKYYSSPTYGKVVANNVGERIARRTG